MTKFRLVVLMFLCWQQAYAHSVYRLSQMLEDESVVGDQVVLLGKHILAEFLCCADVDADYDKLEDVLRLAAQKAHATVIKIVTHKFSPMGMSGIALLSESHISIHTWPEYGYVAIDAYTCGEHVNMQAIIDELSLFFKPQKIRHVLVKRGYDCC